MVLPRVPFQTCRSSPQVTYTCLGGICVNEDDRDIEHRSCFGCRIIPSVAYCAATRPPYLPV